MAANIVIYADVRTLLSNPGALANSGFTTVVVNSLHFNANGTITIDDIVFVTADGRTAPPAAHLRSVIASLKQGTVQRVLVSIGGGGCFKPDEHGINGPHSVSDIDFKWFSTFYWGAVGMTSRLSSKIPVLGGLSTLLQAIGADGVDLDPEPMFYSYGEFASATVTLTEWATRTESKLVTWVPFTAEPAWQATAQLMNAGGGSKLAWVNLQRAAWTSGGDLKSWADSLSVPLSAIVPGFAAEFGDVPATIQQALATVVRGGAAIEGAFFWNYSDIVSGNVAAYVTAIREGLAGNPGSGEA